MNENNMLVKSKSSPSFGTQPKRRARTQSFAKPSSLRREESIVYIEPQAIPFIDMSTESSTSILDDEYEIVTQINDTNMEAMEDTTSDGSEDDINIMELINGCESNCVVDGDENVVIVDPSEFDSSKRSSSHVYMFWE